MFTFNPDLARDDDFDDGDEAFDTANLPKDEEEGEEGAHVVLLFYSPAFLQIV